MEQEVRCQGAQSGPPKPAGDCGICLQSLSGGTQALEHGTASLDGCQHRFCLDCITRWARIKASCPSCRADFSLVTSEGGPGGRKVFRYERVPSSSESEEDEEEDEEEIELTAEEQFMLRYEEEEEGGSDSESSSDSDADGFIVPDYVLEYEVAEPDVLDDESEWSGDEDMAGRKEKDDAPVRRSRVRSVAEEDDTPVRRARLRSVAEDDPSSSENGVAHTRPRRKQSLATSTSRARREQQSRRSALRALEQRIRRRDGSRGSGTTSRSRDFVVRSAMFAGRTRYQAREVDSRSLVKSSRSPPSSPLQSSSSTVASHPPLLAAIPDDDRSVSTFDRSRFFCKRAPATRAPVSEHFSKRSNTPGSASQHFNRDDVRGRWTHSAAAAATSTATSHCVNASPSVAAAGSGVPNDTCANIANTTSDYSYNQHDCPRDQTIHTTNKDLLETASSEACSTLQSTEERCGNASIVWLAANIDAGEGCSHVIQEHIEPLTCINGSSVPSRSTETPNAGIKASCYGPASGTAKDQNKKSLPAARGWLSKLKRSVEGERDELGQPQKRVKEGLLLHR